MSGQLGHILSGSSGSDPVYKISVFCITSCVLIMASVPDQSNEFSVFDDDDGSVSPDFLYHINF